jgi:hypothetical protein
VISGDSWAQLDGLVVRLNGFLVAVERKETQALVVVKSGDAWI